MVAAFDKSDEFAIDKPAQTPCPNLTMEGANRCDCTIHDDLRKKGFGGCVAYDCHGAGQHVTQTIFKGKNWMDDAVLIQRMSAAFVQMETVHELLLLLKTSEKLPLTAAEVKELEQHYKTLCPPKGWTESSLLRFGSSGKPQEIRDFIKSLRHHVKALDDIMKSRKREI